jgi:hypothetical protein
MNRKPRALVILGITLVVLGLATAATATLSAPRYRAGPPDQETATPSPTRRVTPGPRHSVFLPAVLERLYPRIYGRVSNGAGAGLSNVIVVAYRNVGSSWYRVADGITNSVGMYSILVSPGTYQLAFHHLKREYLSQYHDRQENLATADDVLVVDADERVDAVLGVPLDSLLDVVGLGETVATFLDHPPPRFSSYDMLNVCKLHPTPGPTVEVIVRPVCDDPSARPANVSIIAGGVEYLLTPVPTGTAQSTPGSTPPAFARQLAFQQLGNAEIYGKWTCGHAQPTPMVLGSMIVCDPRGRITIGLGGPGQNVGALVQLRQADPADYAPNETPPDETTCHSTNTRNAAPMPTPTAGWGPWSGETPAEAGLGGTAEIKSPDVDSQDTDEFGRYTWHVDPGGCYFVIVDPWSGALPTRVSPLVGVEEDEPVIDLNLHYHAAP